MSVLKRPLLFFVLLLFMFLLNSLAYGNDAVYYGSGVTVYPIKNNDIQLVSEVIAITKGVECWLGRKCQSSNGLGWNVEAVLNFRNHGKKTTVQMGFPFDTDGPNDEDSKEENVPDPKFRTFINGKEAKVTRKKGWDKSPLKDLQYPIVYTFVVPFEQGETKSIRHTYSVHGTEWSTGDTEFKYILRTGALWKGLIENIKITMVLPEMSAAQIHCILPQEHKAEKRQNDIILSWEFTNIKPSFNIIAKTLFGSEPIKLNDLRTEIRDRHPSLRDECCVRYYRNMVFANYGYPFENPLPRMQFYGSGLFREKTDFNFSAITDEDRKVLDFLKACEKKCTKK